MKFYLFNVLTMLLLILFSCKDEEEKDFCKDGFLSPGEEQIDCGGNCPPCVDEVVSYSFAEFDEVKWNFQEFNIVHNTAFFFMGEYENDTLLIELQLNFGNGDTLGARPLSPTNNYAKITNKSTSVVDNYTVLGSGIAVFSDINSSESLMSGFFQAKLAQGFNDTIKITGGQFENATLY